MDTIIIGIAGGTGSGKTTLPKSCGSISAAMRSASSTTTATISAMTSFPMRSAAS